MVQIVMFKNLNKWTVTTVSNEKILVIYIKIQIPFTADL